MGELELVLLSYELERPDAFRLTDPIQNVIPRNSATRIRLCRGEIPNKGHYVVTVHCPFKTCSSIHPPQIHLRFPHPPFPFLFFFSHVLNYLVVDLRHFQRRHMIYSTSTRHISRVSAQ